MIDVNKITSTLAKLPDAQLQQYAQMHKNDPYIMALAMSESNRRKELRDAAPAQQGMQEQPKVVDQMVAEMAPQQMPEEMGIGRLPAGNMNFANGGIVAFAGGGDVEHYYGGGSIFDPVTGVPISSDAPSDSDLTMLERIGLFNPENRRALERGEKALAARKALPTLNKATMPAPGYTRTDPRAAPASAFTDSVKALSDTPPPAAGPRVPPAATAGPTMSGGLASLDLDKMTADALKAAEKQPNPFAKELEAVGSDRVKAKEAEVTGLEAIQKQFSDIYKGRKERLDAKEGEIAKMGNQTLGLSLLQAGAAMMSTPGGIGMALGKGVDVGSKQYIAGLDKINSAKEKLSDARDRLEEIEAQRGELSAREMFKARNEVKNTQISAKEDLIKANMQMYNVNRETALKMVDNKVRIASTVYEQQQANARTAAQIAASNRTPAEIQMVERVMKEKNIPFTEALALLSSSKREGVSEEKLRGEWLDSAKRLQIAQDYPNVKTFEDYKTVMGMGGGGSGFKVVGVR